MTTPIKGVFIIIMEVETEVDIDDKIFDNMDCNEVLDSIAEEIRTDVIQYIPLGETRNLYDSFSYHSTKDTLRVGFNIVYGAYQHQGGDGKRVIVNRPAGGETFFLRHTVVSNRSKYLNILGQDFSRRIQFVKK